MIGNFFIALIHLYRYLISSVTKPNCRFDPTCSRYAIIAIEYYGVRKGLLLAFKRLLKCHPFSKKWGYDPVEIVKPNQFKTHP